MQGAKKQRDADSVKIGVKGAEGQEDQNRKLNQKRGLLELLFEQKKKVMNC